MFGDLFGMDGIEDSFRPHDCGNCPVADSCDLEPAVRYRSQRGGQGFDAEALFSQAMIGQGIDTKALARAMAEVLPEAIADGMALDRRRRQKEKRIRMRMYVDTSPIGFVKTFLRPKQIDNFTEDMIDMTQGVGSLEAALFQAILGKDLTAEGILKEFPRSMRAGYHSRRWVETQSAQLKSSLDTLSARATSWSETGLARCKSWLDSQAARLESLRRFIG